MIKTRRTKRTFSPEFKLEAIEQAVKYQRDVREVALALELNPDHLRKWIRLYKQELQGIEPAGRGPLGKRKLSYAKTNRRLYGEILLTLDRGMLFYDLMIHALVCKHKSILKRKRYIPIRH